MAELEIHQVVFIASPEVADAVTAGWQCKCPQGEGCGHSTPPPIRTWPPELETK